MRSITASIGIAITSLVQLATLLLTGVPVEASSPSIAGLTVVQGAPNHIIDVDCDQLEPGIRRHFVPFVIRPGSGNFDTLEVRGLDTCRSKTLARYNSSIGGGGLRTGTQVNGNCQTVSIPGGGTTSVCELVSAQLLANTRYTLSTTGAGTLDVIFYWALDTRYPAAVWAPMSQTITGSKGTAITPTIAFAIDGPTAPTFSISPSLPAGLSLDPVTGVISGTPTATHPTTTHTVTAAMGESAPTATVTVSVSLYRVTYVRGDSTSGPTPGPPWTVGSSPAATTTEPGQQVTLPTLTREGWTLLGWFTSATGGTRVGGAGDLYEPTASITLHAQWVDDRHVVTYDSQGGSTAPALRRVEPGDSFALPAGPTRSGFVFAGWATAAADPDSRVGGAGDTFMPTEDVTLFALWSPAYTVTFERRGGSGTPADLLVAQGEPLSLPNATRAQMTLLGWYDAPSGGTRVGGSGDPFTPTSDMTLYALWAYRIQFSMFSGGFASGLGPTPPDVLVGVDAGPATLVLPEATRSGHRFDGWWTAASGGVKRGAAGQTWTPTANATLHARWLAEIRVDFDPQSGATFDDERCQILTGFGTPQCMIWWGPGDPDLILPTPVRPGYMFEGWFTASSGGTRIGGGGDEYAVTVNRTYRAQWSLTVTPPGTPRDIVAVPGDQQVTLSWIAPESDGGAPVTGYQVTGTAQGQPDVSCDTTDTTCTIGGLTNGRRYTFRIVARNSEGSSAPTDAVLVTPSGSTWIPTPENTAPTPPPTRGEAQREGRTAVALTATAPAPGRLSFVAIEVQDEDEDSGTDSDGEETPPAPRWLAALAFEGDPSSDAIRGLVARTDRSVVCEVCTDLAAGTELEVWAFSTPRRITTAQVGDDGCVEFVVPLAAPMDGGSPIEPGLHTLQVALPLEDGRLAINVAVTVPAPPPPPAADAPTQTPVTWIPTPENAQPWVPGARGEMQREGGQPVQLAAISSHAGEVGYVDDEGMLSVVFTGDTTTSVERGLVATREDMVRCEVCGEMAPGSIVEIWAFSTPRLVAAAVVDERGCIDVMIPLSAPLDGGPAIEAGQHTLQVVLPMDDGLGRLAVNVGVTVGGLTPTSLPAGEGMPTGAAALLGMLGVALVGLVVALRRSARRDAGLAQGAVGSA